MEERTYTAAEIKALARAFGQPKLLLTVEDAADALSMSRTRLYDLIGAGQIRTVRDGKIVRIPVSELEAWVERRLEESTETWERLLTAAKGESPRAGATAKARSTNAGRMGSGAHQ